MRTDRSSSHPSARRSSWTGAVVAILVLVTGAGLAAASRNDQTLADAIAAQRERAYGDDASAAVLNDLGNLLVLDEQNQAAIQAYERAREIDPSHLPSGFNLGLLLLSTGKHDEALEVLEELRTLHPDHARTHYQVGALREAQGQADLAVAAYVRAFELDPFLALPDVNPQITDSNLVTEALLRVEVRPAEEDEATVRIYSEPSRVTALLVPSEESAETEPEEASAEVAETEATETTVDTEEAAPRVVGAEDLRQSPPAAPTAAPATVSATSPASLPEAAVVEAELEPEEEVTSSRVLSPSDLSNARVNQASPASNRPTRTTGRPTTVGGRRAPATTGARTTPTTRPRATPSPSTARPRSTSPTRFRPGRRSSAQLENRFVRPAGSPPATAPAGQ